MRCIMALRQNFALAICLLCLPTPKRKLVGKVVLFNVRRVDVLETGNVPILLSLS